MTSELRTPTGEPTESTTSAESAPRRGPRLDHGAVGNGRILALISPTSSIDWLCLPRFDSPSVFGRLLDDERGGCFRFLTNGREVEGRMEYLANTNVLRTVFTDGEHAWELIDFAPRVLLGPASTRRSSSCASRARSRGARGSPSISIRGRTTRG